MNGRNTDGRFGAGNSGKPHGARHTVTQAVLALLEGKPRPLAGRP